MENTMYCMRENGLMLYDIKRVADLIEVPAWTMLEYIEKVKEKLPHYSYGWILGEIETIFKRFREVKIYGYENAAKALIKDIAFNWKNYNELVKDSVLNKMVDSWATDIFLALLVLLGAEMPEKVEIVDRNEYGVKTNG